MYHPGAEAGRKLNTPQTGNETEDRDAAIERRRVAALSIGALGVVFGDLGTSPLYTFSSCFTSQNGLAPTPDNVLGVVSLIFWSLVIVVCIKYEALVLRADNNGEGGILALLALLNPWHRKRARILVAMGLFGAALLYGDGMLTSAISVLSALEGLQLGAVSLSRPVIIGLTLAVLVALFALQKRGTGRIGTLFGPVMVLWFIVIGVLGLMAMIRNPAVLAALSPVYAWRFIFSHGLADIVVLGAVFLCLTGAEALYADIGHFGRTPIRVAWFALVMPTLVLSYFGQGALLLLHPGEGAQAMFYGLAPGWFLYPLVGLATVATVIASQSIISGAFSLMAQAINLGQSPRLTVVHTSAGERGQIYIPALNFVMLIGTLAIVLGFQTSANLATAYGVAVSSTMVVTTVLMFFAMRDRWRWNVWIVSAITAGLLAVDLLYFCANVFKITDGGWLPLLVGLAGFTVMSTWSTGRENLIARLRAGTEPLERFVERVRETRPARVEGTGIFLAAPNLGTPPMLQRHLELNKVLPRQVVLLTVRTMDTPFVYPADRLDCRTLSEGFYTVVVQYGFMQSPDVPRALRAAGRFGLEIVPETAIYYVGRETFVAGGRIPGLAIWRAKLFAFLSRNALRATDFYRIPPERTVEIGIRLRLSEIHPQPAAARTQSDLS